MRSVIALVFFTLTLALGSAGSAGATTAHKPIYMPNAQNMQNPALQPPLVCCVPVGPPVAGEPAPVNMAYFGGHVQVTPKIYVVFWGWGQAGALRHTAPRLPHYHPGGATAPMTALLHPIRRTQRAGAA